MKHLPLSTPVYKALETAFKSWLEALGYAPVTVYQLPNYLREFFHYLEHRHVYELPQITPALIESFFEYLCERPNLRQGGGLSAAYLNKYHQCLSCFSKYLEQVGLCPLTILTSHYRAEQQERAILTIEEVEQLYQACEDTLLGLRDRAMLSIIYGCGLRRNEAANLNVKDIIFRQQLLYVRKGKNYKERYVPFPANIHRDLSEYLSNSRPFLEKPSEPQALLLSFHGRRMEGISLIFRLKALGRKAGLSQNLTLHGLRHSIATHLLSKGMKLSHIATFLGHSSLESTQIYTHLTDI